MKGAHLKQKNKKRLANAQIDALLTKIMDNEASRAYIENMPETMAISQIDGYLKML